MTVETEIEKSIQPVLKSYHKRALILGTGGSSNAVAFALHKLGIAFKNEDVIHQLFSVIGIVQFCTFWVMNCFLQRTLNDSSLLLNQSSGIWPFNS